MNNLSQQPFEDLMLAALDGNITPETQPALDAYFDAHPEQHALFAHMQANDRALRAMPMPPVPRKLSVNIMAAIANAEIVMPALALSPQPAKAITHLDNIRFTRFWQVAFLLAILGVSAIVMLGMTMNASPLFKLMLITMEQSEINVFMAFIRSLSSFFSNLMIAPTAIYRVLFRQPIMWIGLTAAVAIVAVWVMTMVAIYKPLPRGA